MSKKQNEITWQRFRSALDGSKDMTTNIGFRMNNGRIVTYEQQKLWLSAYYDKRWVFGDGIHTEPIEFADKPADKPADKLFADKPAFWSVKQIIENRCIWFYHNLFNLVNFQRPDWVGNSSPATFKFTGLIEIANT